MWTWRYPDFSLSDPSLVKWKLWRWGRCIAKRMAAVAKTLYSKPKGSRHIFNHKQLGGRVGYTRACTPPKIVILFRDEWFHLSSELVLWLYKNSQTSRYPFKSYYTQACFCFCSSSCVVKKCWGSWWTNNNSDCEFWFKMWMGSSKCTQESSEVRTPLRIEFFPVRWMISVFLIAESSLSWVAVFAAWSLLVILLCLCTPFCF